MKRLVLGLLIGTVCSALISQVKPPVVLLFAGDLVLSDNVESYVGENTQYVFEHWKPGSESDVFMVNLEHPVTTRTERVEKKYNFKMNPKYLSTLAEGGIRLVTCANNHVADYGIEGVYDTMKYLDSVGVRYVGIGKDITDARRPTVIERKGWKLGFLAYFGGGDFAATPKRAGFAPRYARYIVEDVQKLRKKADYVVVNFHWGVERAEHPEDWQVTLAHRVIDAGADLIIGHHPHILQGVERYRGKYIAYSLGNFVFGGNTQHTYNTAVLKVTVTGEGPVVELVPVSVKMWRPSPSGDQEREDVLQMVRNRSSLFEETLSLPTGGQQ